MQRQELLEVLQGRSAGRPPFIPILGGVVSRLSQTDPYSYATDPLVHARALAEVGQAVRADALTVGVTASAEVGCDAVTRLRPMTADKAIVAYLDSPDVGSARAYCEAGVEVLFLAQAEDDEPATRTIANACHFYEVVSIMVQQYRDSEPDFALRTGMDGIVSHQLEVPDDLIVGGGISWSDVEDGAEVGEEPPGRGRFFWSSPEEVPEDIEPETLAHLGLELTNREMRADT